MPLTARTPYAALAAVLMLAGCAGQHPAEPAAVPVSCVPAPVPGTLFLRGTPSTWALRDDLAFEYRCDAYVLNVDMHGAHEFRITDARFNGGISFGAPRDAAALQRDRPQPLAGTDSANLRFTFAGRQQLRLSFANDAAHPTLTIVNANGASDAVPVSDPPALSLSFDSRNAGDKSPFGAVTAGTEVAFDLRAAASVQAVTLVIELRGLEGPQEVLDYREIDRVPLARTRAGDVEHWRGRYRFADVGVYGYYFLVDLGTTHYVYENNADPIYWTRELGSNGLGSVARATAAAPIRRFRQTVYRADFQVPEWARDIVYYYIFPERFRNGDRRNDPQPGVGTFHDRSVEVHAHWLDRPWRPGSGDGSDELHGNDFFGGDLAGITQKLDYIADLGANTLYLTPIFRAASNHKYDTADYRTIDPHFGSNAEFDRLVRAARQRGIRIILDTSLNHSGSDSIYFDRYAKYPGLGAFDGGVIRPASAFADWYYFNTPGHDGDAPYRGWAGAEDLPELNKAAPSFRAFAFGAQDAVMKLWLDRGAAGWRMDVAPWVPDEFWREWRAAVKQHRPDALAVAETQFEASKFLLGDEFDSTMNYVFRNAVQDYANGVDAREAYRAIELLRELYPPPAFYALMNLLSTHDSARALYEFGWREATDSAQTIARAKQRLRLAAFFQMTFPGAPAVFYGDEVGVTGGEDPFNRVTYPWPDEGGAPDRELLADYQKLIALRRQNAVLRHGSIEAPVLIDAHVIVFVRRDAARYAIVAMNNDAVAHGVTIALPAELADAQFADGLSGASAHAADGKLSFDVPPLWGRVFTNR